MRQEDKQLLLQDLCSRLPYKVMIQSVGENKCLGLMDLVDIDSLPKPYLRPMSSMTEEEKLMYEGLMIGTNNVSYMLDVIDWLNEHHFDYRHLIEKGLAIEASSEIYKKGE